VGQPPSSPPVSGLANEPVSEPTGAVTPESTPVKPVRPGRPVEPVGPEVSSPSEPEPSRQFKPPVVPVSTEVTQSSRLHEAVDDGAPDGEELGESEGDEEGDPPTMSGVRDSADGDGQAPAAGTEPAPDPPPKPYP